MREGTLPNSFHEAVITKARKGHYKKRKLQTNIHDEYICGDSQKKYLQTKSSSTCKDSYHDQMGVISGMQEWFLIGESTNVTYYINRMKNNIHIYNA